MAKDYAKYVSKSKRPPVKKGWRKRLWLIVLSVVAMLGAYFYFSKESPMVFAKRLTEHAVVTKTEPDKDKSKLEEEPNIQFNFYSDLSSMQMATPEKLQPAVVQAPPPAPKPSYILQIAAFRNPNAAGEMRITLLLAGFEVDVVRAMNNQQEIYQVQQGPYDNLGQVKAVQQELARKGIESVVVKKI